MIHIKKKILKKKAHPILWFTGVSLGDVEATDKEAEVRKFGIKFVEGLDC